MDKTKIQKTYIDYGFGFPVKLVNAPLRKIEKDWVLDLNFEKYEIAVLLGLAMKSVRSTSRSPISSGFSFRRLQVSSHQSTGSSSPGNSSP